MGRGHFSHGEIVLVASDDDVLLYKAWYTVCCSIVINQISCSPPPHPLRINLRFRHSRGVVDLRGVVELSILYGTK